METTVLCPDCGGVIGGDGSDGRMVCRCYQPPAPRPIAGMPDPTPPKSKVCSHCGKELEAKKRFRDSMGYWCEACHFSEKRDKSDNHVPCDSCGRYVIKHKLLDYENIRICTRCLKEKQRIARKLRRPVVFGTEHRAHEKKTLLALLGVALLLLLIILLSSMGWLPGWL